MAAGLWFQERHALLASLLALLRVRHADGMEVG